MPAPPVQPLRLRNDETEHEDDGEEPEEREEDVKRLDCFTLGLPLELSTNDLSRKHLAALRPKRLEISLLLQTSPDLMNELADLLADKITTLSIRYLASDRTTVDLPDPADLLSPTLDRFHAVDIHLPALTAPSRVPTIIPHRPYHRQQDPTTSFSQHLVNLISDDPERRKRYAVWLEGDPPMGGLGAVVIKPDERVIREREVDVPWSVRNERLLADLAIGEKDAGSSAKGKSTETAKKGKERDVEGDGGGDHWERETNLRLFGGLLNLRLESKKH